MAVCWEVRNLEEPTSEFFNGNNGKKCNSGNPQARQRMSIRRNKKSFEKPKQALEPSDDRELQGTMKRSNGPRLSENDIHFLGFSAVFLYSCVFVSVAPVSVSVFDSEITRKWFSPARYKGDNRATAHCVPLKALCPVAEKTVAAVYLASALLRSFRYTCSGRPPSLPAALLIPRL